MAILIRKCFHLFPLDKLVKRENLFLKSKLITAIFHKIRKESSFNHLHLKLKTRAIKLKVFKLQLLTIKLDKINYQAIKQQNQNAVGHTAIKCWYKWDFSY